MGGISKKQRVRRQRRFKEAWKDSLYLIKGGLRASLAVAQPLYLASVPAAWHLVSDFLLLRAYADRAGLPSPALRYLLAAVVYRDISQGLTFTQLQVNQLARAADRTQAVTLMELDLIFRVKSNAGENRQANDKQHKGRNHGLYTVGPLGLSLAADYALCCERFKSELLRNKLVPDVKTFVNDYFANRSTSI